jgi:hypothetical protein
MGNAYKILATKYAGKEILGHLGVHGRIILKRTSKRYKKLTIIY